MATDPVPDWLRDMASPLNTKAIMDALPFGEIKAPVVTPPGVTQPPSTSVAGGGAASTPGTTTADSLSGGTT
jgi:hypothetical protein